MRTHHASADFSLVDGLRAPLLAGLLARRGGPQVLLAITATSRESEGLAAALACVTDAEIVEFPAWETLPHERLSPSAETVGKRIDALRKLRAWSAARRVDGLSAQRSLILVASVRAALQPLADNLTDLEPIALTAGGRGYDLTAIGRQLVDLAYSRVDMVTRRGEFAVRGGILDVFSPIADHPVRIEFFGDEVEQLRYFSVADQRSIGDPLEATQFPASRELLLSETVRQRAKEMQHEFPSIARDARQDLRGHPGRGHGVARARARRQAGAAHRLPAEGCRDRGALAGACVDASRQPARDQPRVSRRRLERGDRGSRGAHRSGRRRLPDARRPADEPPETVPGGRCPASTRAAPSRRGRRSSSDRGRGDTSASRDRCRVSPASSPAPSSTCAS